VTLWEFFLENERILSWPKNTIFSWVLVHARSRF
jgi:hypothetical protein